MACTVASLRQGPPSATSAKAMLMCYSNPILIHVVGDTTFELFMNPPLPNLLNTKLLITEATYIDSDVDRHGNTSQQRARDRGHCHLQEFVDNKELFKDIENILLVHFSDKYPINYISKRVEEIVPRSLKDKLHLGTLMKQVQEQYWH